MLGGVKTGSKSVNNNIERLVIDSVQNGNQHAWHRLLVWHFDVVR
jgi:hypothetical protein